MRASMAFISHGPTSMSLLTTAPIDNSADSASNGKRSGGDEAV